jgi:ABC-type nitrate/sulfonate/bicarbonate transport system substrate-binding protein
VILFAKLFRPTTRAFAAACISAACLLSASWPAAAEETMREVNFFVVNNIFGTPVYVAAENGLWASRGLNVKLRIMSSGRQVTQALQAGEAQLGHAAISTTIAAARASGNLLKGVMPYYNAADYVGKAGGRAIIGRKDRGIDPANPNSFLGKTVAILTGSTNEVYMKEWLRQKGVDQSRIKFVSVPIEDMPITLRQGLVDAVASWEPYSAQIVRELGDNAAVVSRGDAGIISDVVGAVANQAWIANNAASVEEFATGLAEAAQLVRKNPDEAALILTRYLDGVNLKDAAEAVRLGNWDPRISICTSAGLVRTGNDMIKAGLIKMDKPFAATDFYDSAILDQVQKNHPEFFDDLPPLPKTLAECKGQLAQ